MKSIPSGVKRRDHEALPKWWAARDLLLTSKGEVRPPQRARPSSLAGGAIWAGQAKCLSLSRKRPSMILRYHDVEV